MLNFHLAGDALVHSIKISGAKLLVVDEDDECRERVEAVRERLEEIGIKIQVLDRRLKGEICRLEPKRPEDKLRDGMKGTFPIFLFYTRLVMGDFPFFLFFYSEILFFRALSGLTFKVYCSVGMFIRPVFSDFQML